MPLKNAENLTQLSMASIVARKNPPAPNSLANPTIRGTMVPKHAKAILTHTK